MADPISPATAADTQQDSDEDEESAAGEREPVRRTRHADAFADAFEAAEKELEPGAKKPAKPNAKAAEPEEKAKPEPRPTPKRQADPEADDADDDAEDGDRPTAAKSERLEPKSYWPRDRRDSFAYQPRSVQEAWLAEAPAPPVHWPQDMKDNFGRQPREAQEAWLTQSQHLERGYSQRFEQLAGERKLAEGIRSAVSPQQRALMQERGLDEVGVFGALMRLQQQSMEDPIGYIRDFATKNRIDLHALVGDPASAGGQQNGQNGAPMQADISSHPAYRALKAEFDALKGTVTNDLQQRQQEQERRIAEDMDRVLAERNEGGDPAYPFVRVLAGTMAEILERNPERYGSMGIRDRFVEAYNIALESFPELKPVQRPAQPKPSPADELDEDDADPEDEAEAEKLKKAATKKSRTPQSAPGNGRGDPFARAFSRAEKQVGHR